MTGIAMDLQKPIGDPLYQVNLTLWMLQPQPSKSATVVPILKEAGFSLRDIERPLPLAPDLLAKLADDKIRVNPIASPDLLLSGFGKVVVIWECKRSTFGKPAPEPESHHRQARNYLLQIPSVLAGALAVAPGAIAATYVAYLSRLNSTLDQTEGLAALRDEMKSRGYPVAAFCLLVLSADKVSVKIGQTGAASVSIPGLESLASPCAVQRCDDDETDPRPLYYLPWMPDSEPHTDSYNYHSFGCRVLNAAAEMIGRTRPPNEATIDFEDALLRATSGYFRLWRNKTTRQAVWEAARKLVREVVTSASPEVKIQGVGKPASGWRIDLPHDKLKGKIIKALRKWPGHDWISPHLTQQELGLTPDGTE